MNFEDLAFGFRFEATECWRKHRCAPFGLALVISDNFSGWHLMLGFWVLMLGLWGYTRDDESAKEEGAE